MNYSSDPSKKPSSSPTPPSQKAYGYMQEQPPAYVVKESDGDAPIQITASEKVHTDDKPVPPAPPSRSPIKPWMIAAGICLVLGAGFSVFLALNPPTVPPDTAASSEESEPDASPPPDIIHPG